MFYVIVYFTYTYIIIYTCTISNHIMCKINILSIEHNLHVDSAQKPLVRKALLESTEVLRTVNMDPSSTALIEPVRSEEARAASPPYHTDTGHHMEGETRPCSVHTKKAPYYTIQVSSSYSILVCGGWSHLHDCQRMGKLLSSTAWPMQNRLFPRL